MTPFPWTLQRYIFRELAKTFALAAIALTGVLGLGGGVANVIRLGSVTPGQLLGLMGLVLPLAGALTLPTAALFSATSTYGRMSADNEFVACRSGGINMQLLLLPTVVLSLFAAVLSFGLTNYLIPSMVRNLNEFVGADFGDVIRQQLGRPRGITIGDKYRIYADQCVSDPVDPSRVALRGVAWVEIAGGDWVRYGTFRELRLAFDDRRTPPRVTALATGVSWYDRKEGRFFENERQAIAASHFGSVIPQKIKFLNLNELFRYRAHPETWERVRDKVKALRTAYGRIETLRALWEDGRTGGEIVVADDAVRLTIRAEQAFPPVEDDWVQLVGVSIDEQRDRQRRHVEADRADIEISRGEALDECVVRVEAYGARLSGDGRTVERSKVVLGPVAIPQPIVERNAGLSTETLLAETAAPGDQLLAPLRDRVRSERGATVRRVLGAIHERFAFSISVFVLIILAAVLGIVLRGAQMTAAFGISFVPALFVIVAIVTGKQMSQNAATHLAGLGVMWGSLIVVAALDVWLLTRVLRR